MKEWTVRFYRLFSLRCSDKYRYLHFIWCCHCLQLYTAISRKVVGKNEHATIPKGKMGYDQCTVPDTIASCRTYFCCFHLALANVHPWPLVPFFQISLKNIVNLKPTTIIPFGIVACTFSENASRNSCLRINASDGLVRINEDLRVIVSCCTKVKNEGQKKREIEGEGERIKVTLFALDKVFIDSNTGL